MDSPPIGNIAMKHDRFKIYTAVIALTGLTLLGFSGCGRFISIIGNAANDSADFPMPDAPSEGASPAPLDMLTHIQIEAGSREHLTAADLFKTYERQEAVFQTNLSPEELAKAGAVYEINVTYLEQPVKVTVEIIDTTPPVIEGVSALSAMTGGSISYKKGIVLSDNADGDIVLTVDNSAVNLNVPGTYPVYYTAADASGNKTSAETTITVSADAPPTEEDAVVLADALIDRIITPDMSKYDAAYTLWNWCRTNIRYSAVETVYDSIWAGAYDGLNAKAGDCYTYCATYAFLLTRCNIENQCVARVGGTSDHWWNLVNTGSGWYHCDASPRRTGDSYLCFMQTDAQVQAYTESYPERPNYYVFDESLYPERAADIIFGE